MRTQRALFRSKSVILERDRLQYLPSYYSLISVSIIEKCIEKREEALHESTPRKRLNTASSTRVQPEWDLQIPPYIRDALEIQCIVIGYSRKRQQQATTCTVLEDSLPALQLLFDLKVGNARGRIT